MAGEAIGKAFRKLGYSIRKNVLDVYIIKIPKWLQEEFAQEVSIAKARISEFYVKREDTVPIIYGRVVEIYPSDFRSPKVNEEDRSQISAISEKLNKEGVTSNEIWDRIAKGNNWKDNIGPFRKAKAASITETEALRKKIFKLIWTYKS